MTEAYAYSAECPICKRPFTASTEEEAVNKVKEHSVEAHNREAHKIEIKKMRALKDVFG